MVKKHDLMTLLKISKPGNLNPMYKKNHSIEKRNKYPFLIAKIL
jgi:hypothetical protein